MAHLISFVEVEERTSESKSYHILGAPYYLYMQGGTLAELHPEEGRRIIP